MKWSEVFHRSQLGPAIFVVAAGHERRILAWLKDRGDAHVQQVEVFSPTRDAWAIQEGGVHWIVHYGFGGLSDGFRVVGWGPLHLAIHDLALSPPRRALLGEPRLSRTPVVATGVNDDIARHTQAELLASASDGPGLQWVARRLIGDHGLPVERLMAAPGIGIWGDLGFTHGAAELLRLHMSAESALTLAEELRERSEPLDPLRGYVEFEAEEIVAAHRIGQEALAEWAAVGIPTRYAVSWIRQGRSLSEARTFVERGGLE